MSKLINKVNKPDNRPKITDTYNVKRTAKFYAKNPKSRVKKKEYDTEYHSSEKRKAYRAELARERRKRGVMGMGGKDVSHKKGGGFVMEDKSKNRARNRAKK